LIYLINMLLVIKLGIQTVRNYCSRQYICLYSTYNHHYISIRCLYTRNCSLKYYKSDIPRAVWSRECLSRIFVAATRKWFSSRVLQYIIYVQGKRQIYIYITLRYIIGTYGVSIIYINYIARACGDEKETKR